MFIREIKKINKKTNKTTIHYSLVSNSWVNNKCIQSTVLYLGTDFKLEKENWPQLTERINSILSNQNIFWTPSDDIENLAQSLAAKIRIMTDSPS
ncbi:MAG: hypothetical protein LBS60_15330 [Deltaproteobacteria bacterium]|jgi:hypothetical protein|nr:hypothetical protein [Deltaproteobacteria bacterium]